MGSKSFVLFWLMTIGLGSLYGQSHVNKKISRIKFEGLTNTQESFLYQQIQSQTGHVAQENVIQNDLQRLKNIAGIRDANYQLDTIDQNLQLTITVEEVRTLLPIFNFGGIEGNVWFQVGFSDINWRGTGQFLSASYQNNDRLHSGNIYLRQPRINDTKWGYSASVSKWASREPLFFPEGTVNYDYNNNSLGLTAIRNIDFNSNVEFGATYFIETYSKSDFQFLENPPGPDGLRQPKWLVKLAYGRDKLDYHFFYIEGLAWNIIMQDVYNVVDKNWFHNLQFQARCYTRFGDEGNLATRIRLGIATNNDTPFAPFVADSHVNIRGIGNRIDRGTAQVILNLEYRHTLTDNEKWSTQIVGFSDIGTWRNPGGRLVDLFDSDKFRQFIGGGFRIIYQEVYGAVLRVDYGIDVFNRDERGLVIGLGQYF